MDLVHLFSNLFCTMEIASLRSDGDILENLPAYVVPIVVDGMSGSGIGHIIENSIVHDGRMREYICT
jgi:hypothetical protein